MGISANRAPTDRPEFSGQSTLVFDPPGVGQGPPTCVCEAAPAHHRTRFVRRRRGAECAAARNDLHVWLKQFQRRQMCDLRSVVR